MTLSEKPVEIFYAKNRIKTGFSLISRKLRAFRSGIFAVSESSRRDLQKRFYGFFPENDRKWVKMASKGPKCRSESTRTLRKSPGIFWNVSDCLQSLLECSTGCIETGSGGFLSIPSRNSKWRPKNFEKSFRFPPRWAGSSTL